MSRIFSVLVLGISLLILSLTALPKAEAIGEYVVSTLTKTPTTIKTATPTPTLAATTCTPAPMSNALVPFSINGPSTTCVRVGAASAIYVHSWNLKTLTINGVDFTNRYALASSLPAKINNSWYIYYVSVSGVGHFEMK